MKYRPWGPIDWALSLSVKKEWHFIGAIGTEERSLCCLAHMRAQGLISGEVLAQIQDVDSEKYRDRTQRALDTRMREYINQGGNLDAIRHVELMAEWFRIDALARDAEAANTSIVLDMTSLPKRFFFPMLRTLVASSKVKNLLLTYASPESYTDDALYEDVEPWRVLPGFGGKRAKPELWIVSIGFMVESLRDYVGDNPDEKMNVLIPFPASLAVLRRTWKSISNLEQGHTDARFEKHRVETLNMSSAFDRIRSLAGTPPRTVAFAPLGPKPTSAAMCLYALQNESSVHYPQPTVYHPDYTTGIRNNDPAVAISAYWIKHEGEFLYNII